MDTLLQDIRYAFRMCVRTPGFTVIAVVALALGIGANTAIFTIVNAVLLERLPFREPQRIVSAVGRRRASARPEQHARPGELHQVARAQHVVRCDGGNGRHAREPDRPRRPGRNRRAERRAAILSDPRGRADARARLSATPRTRDPESAVVILGYDFWQRRFGGDPAILGQSIQLNGRPRTVIGVMPPELPPVRQRVLARGQAIGSVGAVCRCRRRRATPAAATCRRSRG